LQSFCNSSLSRGVFIEHTTLSNFFKTETIDSLESSSLDLIWEAASQGLIFITMGLEIYEIFQENFGDYLFLVNLLRIFSYYGPYFLFSSLQLSSAFYRKINQFFDHHEY
jgi:hypothetical protein